MNTAMQKTCDIIEETLCGHKAFRKVDESLYVVKQGSTYVMITVLPWQNDEAVVRCVAQVLQGARMDCGLALDLLQLNTSLRFGAFAYEEQGSLVLLLHSILGGPTLDPEELTETVRDVAIVADEWDDKLMKRYGGQRMQDLLEEAAMKHILEKDPGAEWEH